MKYRVALAAFAAATSTPVMANQWVAGTVSSVGDWSTYSSGQYGLLISLADQSWGGGDSSNGPTACTDRFRVVVALQGVTEEIKSRIWSAALTGQATGQKLNLYVDTSSGAFCAVKMATLGGPLL